MELLINLIKDINISQLIAMAIIFWFGYSRLDKKIDKIDNRLDKIDTRLSNLEIRITVVETKIVDMNQNITRLMWKDQITHKDVKEK